MNLFYFAAFITIKIIVFQKEITDMISILKLFD